MELQSEENFCLIDEMLSELDKARKSMEKQAEIMSKVVEKSNSVLLQIESTRCLKSPLSNTPAAPLYTFNDETLYLLTKVVESFSKIDQYHDLKEPTRNESNKRCNFEDFLIKNKMKSDILGATVRKLLAIDDAVTQMKLNLEHSVEEETDDSSSE